MAKTLRLRQLADKRWWPLASPKPLSQTRLPCAGIGRSDLYKPVYQLLDHGNTWKGGHFTFQVHDPGSRVEIRKVEVLELP